MFDPETRAFIPKWRAYKDAQCERLGLDERPGLPRAIPGLQVNKSGERQHQYLLVCSLDATEERGAFYEEIIIGQLPQVLMERVGPRTRIGGKMARRPAPEERKPVRLRAIDLSDEEIGLILERWALGKSALELPFVVAGRGR